MSAVSKKKLNESKKKDDLKNIVSLATYHLSIYSFEQRVLVSIYLSEQILIAQ